MDDQMPGPAGLDPAIGETARGWVRVELDAGGQCRDVALDPRALELSNLQLGEAVRDAIQQAQAALRERAERADGTADRLATALQESSAVADQRFGEIAGVLYSLERRAEREW